MYRVEKKDLVTSGFIAALVDVRSDGPPPLNTSGNVSLIRIISTGMVAVTSFNVSHRLTAWGVQRVRIRPQAGCPQGVEG
jgi:hypothetical protein